MKSSDYITVGFIAVFATVVGYFVVNSIMGDPKDAVVKFGYIDEITDILVDPDPEIFNGAAINPTVEVYIGDCRDLNGNGILDDDEKEKCGDEVNSSNSVKNSAEAEYIEENNGLSTAENEKINEEEGFASGTTDQQRNAVNEDIDQHQQEQQETTDEAQINENDPARRETVSGS